MLSEIQGHPHVVALNGDQRELRWSVCAECGALRSILWFSRDRWFCTKCRQEGDARPTVVPLTKPGRSHNAR